MKAIQQTRQQVNEVQIRMDNLLTKQEACRTKVLYVSVFERFVFLHVFINLMLWVWSTWGQAIWETLLTVFSECRITYKQTISKIQGVAVLLFKAPQMLKSKNQIRTTLLRSIYERSSESSRFERLQQINMSFYITNRIFNPFVLNDLVMPTVIAVAVLSVVFVSVHMMLNFWLNHYRDHKGSHYCSKLDCWSKNFKGLKKKLNPVGDVFFFWV